jgi:glucokinase
VTAVPGPSPERPWLVADIGGTDALRHGPASGRHAAPGSSARRRGHRDLADAAEAYLALEGDKARPIAACVAVAGPVAGDSFRLTNAGDSRGCKVDLGVFWQARHLTSRGSRGGSCHPAAVGM